MKLVEQPLRDEIARKVQEALDRHQPRQYRIEVDRNAIMADDDWYHVVVKSEGDQRDRDFYDALVSAEEDIENKSDGHTYLLVPVIAD